MAASYNKMRRNNVVNSNKNIKKRPVKIPRVGKAANSDFCHMNKTKGSKKSAGASVKGGFNPISNRNVNLGKNSGSKGNLKAKNSMLANSITKNRGRGSRFDILNDMGEDMPAAREIQVRNKDCSVLSEITNNREKIGGVKVSKDVGKKGLS
ncbi:hypothetical protein ACOSQ2_027182 [Xanthoceras sorbifolium]